jgi:hypothetical protein
MDGFAIAIASVLALTAAAWLARILGRVAVCPICAGVSGTWAWMVVARMAGFAVEPAMLALLLGASVVAGAHWVEGRLPAGRSALAWKSLALPAGFTASYGLVAEQWITLAFGIAALGLLLAFFLRALPAAGADPAAVAELEQRMKKCC